MDFGILRSSRGGNPHHSETNLNPKDPLKPSRRPHFSNLSQATH